MELVLHGGIAITYNKDAAIALQEALSIATRQFNAAVRNKVTDRNTYNVSHSLTQMGDGNWCASVYISILGA